MAESLARSPGEGRELAASLGPRYSLAGKRFRKGALMVKKIGNLAVPIFFLQLALGVFFLVFGVSNLTNYNSDWNELRRAFGRNDTLALVTAVVEIVMGALLVLGLFLTLADDVTKILGLALFVLWGLYMVVTFIVNGFLKPDFLTWLYRFSWNAVILISIWIVGRRYA
jgi:uncharacterized membrane protein YphA (DoxX/SURF4 family)